MPFSPDITSTLQATRLWLTAAHPFYASLLARMRIVITTKVPTAAVDARDNLYINPAFYLSLPNVRQRGFLHCHEALHPALDIFARSRSHDPHLANEAHDHVINLILALEGPQWIIAGVLKDEKFAGMAYEDVYAILKKEGPPSLPDFIVDILQSEAASDILGDPTTVFDDGFDGRRDDRKADKEGTSSEEWGRRFAEAAATAAAMGRLSAGANRILAFSRASRVHWSERLAAAVRDSVAHARSNYNLPARRSDALGYFVPTEETLGCDATVYVDTSGSVSADQLQIAVSEIAELLALCAYRVRWLEGDAAVLKDEWISAVPEMVAGGGGTSFVPLFEHLRFSPTKTLIVFTDTWGTMPEFVPDFPVVWAVYQKAGEDAGNRVIPFGEIVPVPEHELTR